MHCLAEIGRGPPFFHQPQDTTRIARLVESSLEVQSRQNKPNNRFFWLRIHYCNFSLNAIFAFFDEKTDVFETIIESSQIFSSCHDHDDGTTHVFEPIRPISSLYDRVMIEIDACLFLTTVGIDARLFLMTIAVDARLSLPESKTDGFRMSKDVGFTRKHNSHGNTQNKRVKKTTSLLLAEDQIAPRR